MRLVRSKHAYIWCRLFLLLQMNTIRWNFIIFAVWTHVVTAYGGRVHKTQVPRFDANGATALHVIGDTHGDENYLVRCLLSTELFYLNSTTVEWRADLAEFQNFEVVILGDMIDRGLRSKKVLQLLARLNKAEPFGKHLHVLLGNHEDMTLRYQMQEWVNLEVGHYMVGDWNMTDRKVSLRAKSGTDDYELMEWLRNRKVAYFHEGAILMHGGLSEEILYYYTGMSNMSYSAACAVGSTECAARLVDFFNNEARHFYDEIHDCIQCAKPPTFASKRRSIKNKFRCGHRALDCEKQVETPMFLNPQEGILNFRGYTSIRQGANQEWRCESARNVGEAIGAKVMVLAHTTHMFVVQYCDPQVVPAAFPIIVTDTHRTDCMMQVPPECDFDPTFAFHRYSLNRWRGNVPQSLRMTDVESAQTCLSRVVPDGAGSVLVEVACEPVLKVGSNGMVLLPDVV
eukprot:TRINITY_DN43204_c0_g1_i1.p1 TRINITY_DN43204_c0_g1~~TRINITY_DN43204_c0_g1_i1.p1  ORF type:complete len:456 (+),score=27.05 TRINITY_DN43204_c0_g1_i1:122-1489(+)